MEPIRLVIWDLDNTFWKGTLTEGGIEIVPEHCEIVRELARRGIMSSICSKNELEEIRPILEKAGVWDFFIFPSIDWTPKGARVRKIVDSVQLRPETIMFLDDNPGIRAEVQATVPGLCVADETVIPTLLSDLLFKGKKDPDLTRLAQYKLMEKKKEDSATFSGDNSAFLKASDIRLYIENDLSPHMERVVELINRTNQLNFTKRRLPDSFDEAVKNLKQEIDGGDKQAGLIRVADNYGDYGFCGFFLKKTDMAANELLHFCFSCRVMDMGIEAFVYHLLGRPALVPVGEVLSDPVHDPCPDWIRVADKSGISATNKKASSLNRLYIRGGCDLKSIDHYASMSTGKVTGEYFFHRSWFDIRLDHSLISRYCLEGVPQAAASAFRALGYSENDFQSEALTATNNAPRVLSFSPDFWQQIYRHKTTDALIPFALIPDSERENSAFCLQQAHLAIATLQNEFLPAGIVGEYDYKYNLDLIFKSLPQDAPVFVLTYGQLMPKEAPNYKISTAFEEWTLDAARQYKNVTILPFRNFVASADEVAMDGHMKRLVYFRTFEYLKDLLSK